MERTKSSSRRLQKLFDTGKYTCMHRRYSNRGEPFHTSLKDMPIGYPYLEVKLIRKDI